MSITKSEYASKYGEQEGQPVYAVAAVSAVAPYQQFDQPAPAIVPQTPPVNQQPNSYASNYEHNITERDFTVPCLAIGDPLSCLYSWCCPQCAMGTARSQLDGSDFCVTCFNINPIVLRWATRSAYHIRGELWEDCLLGLFCPCCTINQALQTTKQYGRPHQTVGPEQHSQVFSVLDNNECFANCMYSTFCLPCAIGTSLERSMGMPFVLGCCCTNFCIARNLLRYHYRIIGNDCCEDCVAPYSLFAVTYMCAAFIPCVACCTYPYFVTMVMLMVNEAQKRGFTGSYLTPPPVLYTDNARLPAQAAYVQQQQQPVMVPVTVMPAAQVGAVGQNPQFQS